MSLEISRMWDDVIYTHKSDGEVFVKCKSASIRLNLRSFLLSFSLAICLIHVSLNNNLSADQALTEFSD